MKIQIYFDYTCPYCYIAYTRINKAIEKLEFGKEISLNHHSFQLDPNHINLSNLSIYEELANKLNITETDAKKILDDLTILGKKDEINFNFNINKPTNTLNVHRVTKLSKFAKVEKRFIFEVFKAHFQDGKNISEDNVLLDISNKVGLDTVLVRNILETSEYLDGVNADLLKARKYKIISVPFFIINNKNIIEGIKSVDYFLEVLTRIYNTANKTTYCCSGDCL